MFFILQRELKNGLLPLATSPENQTEKRKKNKASLGR